MSIAPTSRDGTCPRSGMRMTSFVAFQGRPGSVSTASFSASRTRRLPRGRRRETRHDARKRSGGQVGRRWVEVWENRSTRTSAETRALLRSIIEFAASWASFRRDSGSTLDHPLIINVRCAALRSRRDRAERLRVCVGDAPMPMSGREYTGPACLVLPCAGGQADPRLVDRLDSRLQSRRTSGGRALDLSGGIAITPERVL